MPEPLTITLSPDLSEKIRAQAASQGYASEAEFVEDHISEAVESDPELENWLRTVGVERYDAYDANPENVYTAAQIRARLAEHREQGGMTKYDVVFSYGMDQDIFELRDYIALKRSIAIAENFLEGLITECETLGLAPYRGTKRRELRPNMRLLGYKHAVSVLFRVEEDKHVVVLLGISYRGRSINRILERYE